MILAIDVGNTRVKAAVFEQNTLKELKTFNQKDFLINIKTLKETYSVPKAIIASVSKLDIENLKFLEENFKLTKVNSSTKVPFQNLYTTPTTLGVDRICLASAAAIQYPNQNVLVIDAGTCITYDFLNDKNEYLGGAISPGIEMRYKSLPEFTANLPLLEKEIPENFIGNNTFSSIHSGIINGVLKEIEGVINQYEEEFMKLTVVLTGGDTNFLSEQLKNSIFANQNFLLQGLNDILIFNESK